MNYAERKVFKLKRHLGRVLVHKYCKTKVQEEQLIAKSKLECLDDFRDSIQIIRLQYEQKFHLIFLVS